MIEFLLGSTAYGTLPAIVDPADGITPITPDSIACLVIKNGTNTAETVATDAVGGGRTGVYKWSFAADAPVAGDRYSLVYTVTIAAAPYYYTLDLICVAVMRGTDNSLKPTVSGRTLNVNTDGEGDAVLDSAEREAIAAEIESRALTLTAAYDAAKTAASQTSVDDIPTNAELATALSGKATTSDVTTVGTAVANVSTLIGTPVTSVSADIAAVKSDTNSLLNRVTSGITALIANLTAMITGSGASAKFTTVAVSNVTGGGPGGTPAVTLTLGATIPLTVGQVTGLTEDLVIGDSYSATVGRRIPITLTDKDGDPVSTAFGDRSLADDTCTIMCVLHPENSRNIDNVVAAAQGTCEFVAETVDDPASLWLTLPKTQTERLNPGVYKVQFRATWDDGETVTLAWKGSCKFVRRITAKKQA